MHIIFSAMIGIAFWVPVSFNFTMPEWFTNQFSTPIISPQPTPFVFPNMTPLPTKTPYPKPSTTPTSSPKPTIKPSASVKLTVSPTPRPSSTTTTTFSTQQVLSALNQYRSSKGVPSLQFDDKLQSYAQSRANYLKSRGSLDNHAGFNNFIQNEDGFTKLGFNSLAENQSWNYKGTATGLISEFYAKSLGHNTNQLNGEYTHVGIGISGVYTNIVFGGRKR